MVTNIRESEPPDDRPAARDRRDRDQPQESLEEKPRNREESREDERSPRRKERDPDERPREDPFGDAERPSGKGHASKDADSKKGDESEDDDGSEKNDASDKGKSGDDKEDSAPKKPKGPPWYKRKWAIPAMVATGVILLIAGALIWWHVWKYESTDDAYTAGHVVEVSAQVAGRVEHVLVDDNDDVRQGQVVVELDPRDFDSSLRQAEANLNVAQAEKDRADAVLKRFERVNSMDGSAVSPQDRDEAIAAARKADATVSQNEAQVNTARLQLSYTKIVAPFAGRIARKSIEPGAFVTQGQAMMAVVDPRLWIEANFKETQLKIMKVGDPVRIKIDAYPHLVWQGHVDSIQPGSGSEFSLLPPENATGNFVKVVQRVPVKIVFDDYVPPAPRYRPTSDNVQTQPMSAPPPATGPADAHAESPQSHPFLGVGISVRPRVTVR